MRVSVGSSIMLVCIALTLGACEPKSTLPDSSGKTDPELYFVRGYRFDTDPCQLTGETEYTNKFLDDAADLVTCLNTYEDIAEFVQTTGAIVVAQTKTYTLYRVPRR